MVPGLQELLEERVAIHSKRSTDALHTSKVRLTGPLHVESHPVTDTAQEGDPGVVLVQNLKETMELLVGVL